MTITVQDKGKYLRGLLLLIGKDHQFVEPEKNWIYKISKILGYDVEFCKTAIKELPENEYLSQDPPQFTDPEIAKAFIIDGIHLAYADKTLQPNELLWINAVAESNNVSIIWGMNEYEKFRNKRNTESDCYEFAIEKYLEPIKD